MKYLKRAASLLLALVMVLALAAPAFAAEGGTITVDNPKAETTYTAYKIFDVVYSADKSAYSYTIKNAAGTWFSEVIAYMGSTWNQETNVYTETQVTADDKGVYTDKGITLTPTANDPDLYVVTVTEAEFSAADFAKFLNTKTGSKTGTELQEAAAGTGVSATGLELGYYFVSSGSGALCNLTTTNPTVTIHDKNDVPFDKVDDKESVEIGEVVNYVITGKVPDTTGFTTYEYQITDKMSDGLTFNNDVEVYIDGTEITDNFTLETGDQAGEKDFVLDINVMNLAVGAKIEVKYSATVNANAVAKIENNHAILTYSNDPTDSTKTTTREDKETVYSAKIIIDKYAANPDNPADKDTKLAGAKFVLYKEVTEDGTTTKLYYKYTAADATAGTAAKVDWVTDQGQPTEVTTDEYGSAEFIGLKDGTYYLLETEAPAGYNLLTEPVTITINGTSATETDVSTLTHNEGVANNTGTVLPSTGGMGTTLFYALGGVLVLAAVVLLVTKKRMAK